MINEQLPPDLRALDQMCLSIQFFLLGALHASGIVMTVLGYMLVLHKDHNVFGDPVVIPIFSLMFLLLNLGKRVIFKFADRFHVFEIEWDAEAITWRVDGESYGSVDISTPDKKEFHLPHFILLNIAVGGAWAGRPDETTAFPQFMYVDWVRVYQK